MMNDERDTMNNDELLTMDYRPWTMDNGLNKLILLIGLLLAFHSSYAQTLSFPGAEGFGKYTSGGRGGKVIYVTNLNDSGDGSLRKAITTKGPRTILFAVAGNIELESPLNINNPDVTIAGQSAPGEGICIKNYSLNVKADNVIIRFMRFRMGDEKGYEGDAIGANRHNQNIIIDHCSMSWATDECASFYHNKNFTMQWCIISESLNQSVHAKGAHGYGGIWGGENASFHHNLLANHNSRNPRFSGSSTTLNGEDELVEFANNVIYNWGMNSAYGGEKGKYNLINNYYKPGLATHQARRNRLVEVWSPYGQFYIAGNLIEGNQQVSENNWDGGVQGKAPDSARVNNPFKTDNITLQTAKEAYLSVLAKAGASYVRDAVDARIIEEVRLGISQNGKNKNGIIDSQKDVGGWPVLKDGKPVVDTDKDGIPDSWEKANGLNPNDPADAVKFDEKGSGYTYLELYLNSLVNEKSKRK